MPWPLEFKSFVLAVVKPFSILFIHDGFVRLMPKWLEWIILEKRMHISDMKKAYESLQVAPKMQTPHSHQVDTNPETFFWEIVKISRFRNNSRVSGSNHEGNKKMKPSGGILDPNKSSRSGVRDLYARKKSKTRPTITRKEYMDQILYCWINSCGIRKSEISWLTCPSSIIVPPLAESLFLVEPHPVPHYPITMTWPVKFFMYRIVKRSYLYVIMFLFFSRGRVPRSRQFQTTICSSSPYAEYWERRIKKNWHARNEEKLPNPGTCTVLSLTIRFWYYSVEVVQIDRIRGIFIASYHFVIFERNKEVNRCWRTGEICKQCSVIFL